MDELPNPKALEFLALVRRSLADFRMDSNTLETRFEAGGIWIGWPGVTRVTGTVRLTREQLESAELHALAHDTVKQWMAMSSGAPPASH